VSEGALPDESADLPELDGAQPPEPRIVTQQPVMPMPALRQSSSPGRSSSPALPASGAAARTALESEDNGGEATDEVLPSEASNRPDAGSPADPDTVPRGITRLESVPRDDPERYTAVERDSLRVEPIENIERQPE